MILVAALAYAFVVAIFLRGDLGHLAAVRLRFEWVIVVGFLLQFFVAALPFVGRTEVTLGWLLGAILLILTFLANWSHTGLRVIAAGVLLNALVIFFNWGMPVAPEALAYLGAQDVDSAIASASALYFLSDGAVSLSVLGDVLPIPGPSVVRSIVSLGDLLLMVGVVVFVLDVTRPPTHST